MPKIRRSARTDTPYLRFSVVVMGQAQIDTWDAMCALTGRRPHQLAADIVLAAIRQCQGVEETFDPLPKPDAVKQLVNAVRHYRQAAGLISRHLRLVGRDA